MAIAARLTALSRATRRLASGAFSPSTKRAPPARRRAGRPGRERETLLCRGKTRPAANRESCDLPAAWLGQSPRGRPPARAWRPAHSASARAAEPDHKRVLAPARAALASELGSAALP